MTVTALYYHLFSPLLAVALASGFQVSPRGVPKLRVVATHSGLNKLRCRVQEPVVEVEDCIIGVPPPSSLIFRPLLMTVPTIAAAAIFASTSVIPSYADDSFDMSRITTSSYNEAVSNIHPETMSVIGDPYSSLDQHITTANALTLSSSSLQLSSSTMANPIGEFEDGSSTGSIENSFGQWFFVIYIVVSLLAGGKEMISRIQKQMDKNGN